MNRLSVLVAAYEAQVWLEACIDSIIQQALPKGVELELIIGVDACSDTLETAKALLPYLAPKDVKILLLEQNSGPYVMFNTMMNYASGEGICRFDADDVMLPGYLKKQFEQLQLGSQMTMTWSIFTDVQLRPTPTVLEYYTRRIPNEEFTEGCEGQFMLQRGLWNNLGGFRPWRCGADTDLLDRILALGVTPRVIEEFLYYRRMHKNSLTRDPATNFDSELRINTFKMLDRHRIDSYQHKQGLQIEPLNAEVTAVYEN